MNATAEAENIFRQRLAAEVPEGNALNLAQSLRLFRSFAQEPFACAEDALLWETGACSDEEDAFFFASLTRQFTLEEDGEYDGMEQLHLTLRYPPEAGRDVPQTTLWSFDCGDDFAAFFAAVEKDPAFLALAAGPAPVGHDIVFEEL